MKVVEKQRRTKPEKMLADAKKLLTQLSDLFTSLAIEAENRTKEAREFKKEVDRLKPPVV